MILHRICYASRNLIKAADCPAEFRGILARARTNNAARGITGILMFSANCFVQTLEGDLADIEDLLDRIQRDERHCDLMVLQKEPIARRDYGDWSMAFVAGDDVVDALAGVETSRPFNPDDPSVTDDMRRHLEAYAA